jgi:hypothetical protein
LGENLGYTLTVWRDARAVDRDSLENYYTG